MSSEIHHSSDEDLIFADEDGEDSRDLKIGNPDQPDDSWHVLIVDDEVEIHQVTKLALHDFGFEHKTLSFISAYTGAEAKQILAAKPNIAVVLLDVIMESDDAGLQVVDYIRNTLHNDLIRIILRTGQPGQVPESVVAVNYGINDYKSKTELTTQKLFTTLVTALRSFQSLAKLIASKRELEAIASAAYRFVPQELLQILQKESVTEVSLGDRIEADMTVLFADIRSFTNLSKVLSTPESFEFLNSFINWIGPITRQYGGFINKYIGDGVMALFPHPIESAIEAAIAMQQQISVYNSHPNNQEYLPIGVGIGLQAGNLTLGTLGEGERLESVAIAETVTLATRMESLTRLYNVGIITTLQTIARVANAQDYHHRLLDYLPTKEDAIGLEIVEIYAGDPPATIEAKNHTKAKFEEAVVLYHQQEFSQAAQVFQQVLDRNSLDRAATIYLERCYVGQHISSFASEGRSLSSIWPEFSITRNLK